MKDSSNAKVEKKVWIDPELKKFVKTDFIKSGTNAGTAENAFYTNS